jgi:hypothetical protein
VVLVRITRIEKRFSKFIRANRSIFAIWREKERCICSRVAIYPVQGSS